MTDIGGFFGIELSAPKPDPRFADAIALNCGRNGFRHFVASRPRPKRVWTPIYCCDVVLDVFFEAGIEMLPYGIDNGFRPQLPREPEAGEWLLYTNYFGVCDDVARTLISRHAGSVLLDNAQAYFSDVHSDLCTVYSPRKFFGVPDGGYLFADGVEDDGLPQDESANRALHLLQALEQGARGAAEVFRRQEDAVGGAVKRMSALTRRLLAGADRDAAAATRTANFRRLHERLGAVNMLRFDAGATAPQSYPLLVAPDGLKDYMAGRDLLLPTYWLSVLKRAARESLEARLTRELVVLPVDARYDAAVMDMLAGFVANFLSGAESGEIASMPSSRHEYW